MSCIKNKKYTYLPNLCCCNNNKSFKSLELKIIKKKCQIPNK